MPARRRSQKARSYHHGDLRRALLDAALEILDESGVSGLSLRGAARRAGVSHAAPAHHFGDLWGLHCAIAEEGFAQLGEHMGAAGAKAHTPGERLERYGVAYVDFAVRRPGRFRAMFHPWIADRTGPASLRRAADAAYALLLDVVRDAQAAGQLRAGSPPLLALSAWVPVHGLATLAIDGQLMGKGFPSRDPVQLAERILRELGGGLRH